MEPYLREGDHVLTFNWGKVKEGDVVVFRFFTEKGSPMQRPGLGQGDAREKGLALDKANHATYYIKRITKISGQSVFVQGDNKKLSSKVGPIKKGQIIGKVVLKY
jgi:signal peptidase I